MAGRPRRVYFEVTCCGICGEESHNRHFGGPACESCRAFFRRSVKKRHNYRCVNNNDGHCAITGDNRNDCKKCRYDKCLSVGMNPKLVDRRVIQAIEKKQQQYNSDCIERIYNPDIHQFKNRLTDEEYTSVVELVVAFANVASQITHERVTQEIMDMFPNIEIADHLAICVGTKSRATLFMQLLPDFQRLRHCDRGSLLSCNLIQMLYLRKYYGFDHRYLTWPSDSIAESKRGSPKIPINLNCWNIFLTQRLITLRKDFVSKLQTLKIDEPTSILLMIIALFSPETPGLIDVHKVEAIQERYLSILCKYVQWRYGVSCINIVYPKILSLLTDLREMCESQEENTYPHDNAGLSYICAKLSNWYPFVSQSIDDVPCLGGSKCQNICEQSDIQMNDEEDLYLLLESMDDVMTSEPDLEHAIKTEELLHPLFLNVPDLHFE